MNICSSLECETVGELANVFQHKGADFVMGMRNCGKKTHSELSAVVYEFSGGPRDSQLAFVGSNATDQNNWKDIQNSEPLGVTADELLEAIERLQIPYGLPTELIRLPTRIRNWCKSREWNTLGQFLHSTGGMGLNDLLAVDNIGRKSAAEVLGFFDALRTQQLADLRIFLPLSANSSSVSLHEALNDLIVSLDTRDLRILEMRVIDGASLETIGHHFRCTRELVRQVEDRFLQDVKRILDWFSDERIELWQTWETTDNLALLLSEKGVAHGPVLVAAAVSTVFEKSPEGVLLNEHWQETFREWGRELMASESNLSGGVDLSQFAKNRGAQDLACRFQAWLEMHFGDGLSVVGGVAIRTPKKLMADQRTLLYGAENYVLRWRALYERLKQFCADHGDADVPSGWKADRQLAVWVSNQRERKKKGAMSEEEFALLDELGLTWKSRDVGTWEDRLAEVAAFKARHGHCEIPSIFSENPKLGRFANTMRTQKNRGTLSAERIAKLDSIGFAWASGKRARVELGEQMVSKSWKTRFVELLAYKQTHGDCDVPAKWEQNERLANWVSMQRQMKKRGLLPEERVKLLEEIGFNWRADRERQSWNVRYEDLMEFKELHGHCDVPLRYSVNPSLGVWVANQRYNKKRGKLSIEQERMLNLAGFPWQAGPKKTVWEGISIEAKRGTAAGRNDQKPEQIGFGD